MGRIYGALPAYSFVKNGSNDLIIMIDTDHDTFKVTFNVNSSNNGDIPPTFCHTTYLLPYILYYQYQTMGVQRDH